MTHTRLNILTRLQDTVRKVSDPRFFYGPIDKILLHNDLVPKYPTEIEACGELYDPNNDRYVPAPTEASHLRCHGCRKMKRPNAFGKDARCVLRQGRQTDCHECRRAKLKLSRLKARKEARGAA